jgi:serine/threonine protein kinase
METKQICPSCRKTLPTGVPLGLCPECLIKSGFNTGTEPGNPGKASGFVPPPVEQIRKLFPQLEIIELVGKGGMGAVYKARQTALDRLVALKILPPGAAGDAGFAERFNREARALARLNHPHIVAVHDFGQVGGQPYLVMEFVDGPNLRQVEQAGRLTAAQALEIVPQICEALQFAHNEGVVHRDIKPENILLDKRGRVKITDFGIAKILGAPSGKSSLTGAKDVLGTPHYMAPEQVEHPQTVDHRADIYSLGVVFYELLTGELPLGKFQPPSKKVQVDVRLDEVVLHTLEKEPERRYQHVSEVKTDVETIAGSRPGLPAAKSPMVRIGEAAWGITFSSPAAIRLLNLSALGSLGFLSALGTRWSVGFSAFFSLYALFVVAYLLETANARGSSAPATGESSKGISGWLRWSLIPEDTAARWAQWLSFGAALVILVLGFLELPKFDLRPHELFFGVLLVLILTFVILVAGYLVGAARTNRLRQGLAPRPDAPAASGHEGALAKACQEVKAPATWLVVTGILNWILIPLAAVVIVPFASKSRALPPLNLSTTAVEVVCVASLVLCSLTIFAALKMQRLEAYRLAIIGSLLAIFVSPGNIIGLPVGIWSLAVLSRRQVREAFGQTRRLPPECARPKRGGLAWLIAAAACGLALLVIARNVETSSRLAREQNRQTSINRGAMTFGPVVETVLKDEEIRPEGRVEELLDLDTGRRAASSNFGDNDRETHLWVRTNQLDVIGVVEHGQIAVLCFDTVVIPAVSNDWETVTAQNLVTNWNLAQNEPNKITGISPATDKTDTWLFRTREGGRGLLQILGQSNDPLGVKIRYKLVQPDVTGPQPETPKPAQHPAALPTAQRPADKEQSNQPSI